MVVPLSGRQGQQLYPHCGTKPPRSSRADYCGDCAELINALKSRRRHSVDTSARRILRWILPDRKDPSYPEGLKQLAEPPLVLGVGLQENPLSRRVRKLARERYEALSRKRLR